MLSSIDLDTVVSFLIAIISTKELNLVDNRFASEAKHVPVSSLGVRVGASLGFGLGSIRLSGALGGNQLSSMPRVTLINSRIFSPDEAERLLIDIKAVILIVDVGVMTVDFNTAKSESGLFFLNNFNFFGSSALRTFELNPVVLNTLRPDTAESFTGIDLVAIVSILESVGSTQKSNEVDLGVSLKLNTLPLTSGEVRVGTGLGLMVTDIWLRSVLVSYQLLSVPRPSVINSRLFRVHKLELHWLISLGDELDSLIGRRGVNSVLTSMNGMSLSLLARLMLIISIEFGIRVQIDGSFG